MNRWRVGEDRGSKETDGCPLTVMDTQDESSELRRRLIQDNTSGGELLVIDK
jgi:hypothetical protein